MIQGQPWEKVHETSSPPMAGHMASACNPAVRGTTSIDIYPGPMVIALGPCMWLICHLVLLLYI
jgi:hypothetical protein